MSSIWTGAFIIKSCALWLNGKAITSLIFSLSLSSIIIRSKPGAQPPCGGQIKKIRSDLECKLIRGNVDTRIKKLKDGTYDAIILSYAGIKFLNFDSEISEIFSPEKIIPSAGQGIIALQCREGDEEIISVLKKINHNETFMRAHVERNILKVLEGDCETAVGAHSVIAGDKITVEAELFSLDGSKRYYEKKTGKVEDFSQIGEEVGQILKTKSNNSYKR